MPSRLLRYAFGVLMLAVGALLAGAVSGAVQAALRNLIGPRFDAWRIEYLLKSEPHYVESYSRNGESPEPFRFTVRPSGPDRELIVQPILRDGTTRVFGRTQLEPGVQALLLERDEAQRNLETQIETALVGTRVVYQFVNSDGEGVNLQNADAVLVEYRMYDLSRQELFDGIVEVDNTLDFIESRTESVAETYKDYS
jgi:hypothetical protein